MSTVTETLAVTWRLAAPYFRADQMGEVSLGPLGRFRLREKWAGRGLLAAVVAIELAIVAITVALNAWNARFYDALQNRNWDSFVYELGFFCVLAAAFILLAVYQVYLNQWLQIRWRRWMTERLLGEWLAGANHYRMQLLGESADNPDQRIAEDIQLFVGRTLSLGVGLLSAVVTLVSFVGILWALSAQAPLMIGGTTFAIPGYLVLAALIYAALGTLLTHLIGRALVRLNFDQQRFEADFRVSLVRVRENAEQIALLGGEEAERTRLMERFAHVMRNWWAIMDRQKRLTFFTAGYSQVSTVFPFIVASPAYFAGAFQLGGLMQTASAFGRVENALAFFISAYTSFAEWRAVVQRLGGFEAAAHAARLVPVTPPVVQVERSGAGEVRARDLELGLPDGRVLLAVDDFIVAAGERVLVTGPSGSGKSTLFRAVGGIWPFGEGVVRVPEGASVMLLPQRPYLPVDSLRAAVSFPAAPGTFADADIEAVLRAVGLPAFAGRLDEVSLWGQRLSGGEQQRLAFARALLHAPDWLFLDEATASLDEASEAALYRLLMERLPGVTVVSIGHRSTLAEFHGRTVRLVRDGAAHRVVAPSPQPA
ncbi:ABC transporter ATP-binding protein/permease [Blastochloris sulfoviridis]|uniref:ABC transporter ATP-binding protein/permease n=1 Tax=Blastochloris sulfoviridis TaxID=50712 RepID=A0A5M6I4K8_9HYPH|nr:ABC transporter ATP-binding protein/permease [Blastochloris sulfoviridis]KAA5603161.1 ABC transporter ATP-binding protein/permease [Blastochloris sulfoviridis]